MAKFLTGNELNTELEKLFEKAEDLIILISPYIKLHERYVSTLKTKLSNPKLEVIIVFGKNEEDLSRSMKQEDFHFFKQFPNIQIRYEKRLHAKYYANENVAILTSMNLYSYSQDNNIEAGVLTKGTFLGNLTSNLINNVTGEDSLDNQAWTYFRRVIDQSDLLFHKTPQYESAFMGLTKKYKESKIEVDKLTDFFSGRFEPSSRYEYNDRNKYEGPQVPKKYRAETTGYCIRTGVSIPFNVEKPLSYDAYKKWNEFADPDYPEKFCHFSGEPSNGETSVSKPILKKNWKKAKELFDL